MKSFFNPLKTVVEITSDCIKIVQLRNFGRKIVLERAEYFDLSDNSSETIIKELKRISKILDFNNAAVAVLGRQVNIKNFLFTNLSNEEIKKAINWKIDQSLAYPSDEYILNISSPDSVDIENRNGKNRLVVATAVLKKDLVMITEEMKKAGIAVDYIESQARALYLLGKKSGLLIKDEISGFLDIGAHSTNLSVFEGNILRYARDFSYGLNLNDDQMLLEKIIENLKESMEYYKNTFGIKPFSKLFITGGGTKEEIIRKINDRLQPKCQKLDFSNSIINNTNIKDNNLQRFSVAIGIGLQKRKDALFVPTSFFSRIKSIIVKNPELSISACAVLIMIFNLGWKTLEYGNYSLKEYYWNKRIMDNKVTYTKISGVYKEIENMKKEFSTLKNIQKRGFSWSIFLMFLSNIVPENVTVEYISQNGKNIEFRGYAMKFSDVTELLEKIKNYPQIKDNKLDEASVVSENRVEFTLKMRIKDNG